MVEEVEIARILIVHNSAGYLKACVACPASLFCLTEDIRDIHGDVITYQDRKLGSYNAVFVRGMKCPLAKRLV